MVITHPQKEKDPSTQKDSTCLPLSLIKKKNQYEKGVILLKLNDLKAETDSRKVQPNFCNVEA